jgi:uroporphyrinogen-III synthase
MKRRTPVLLLKTKSAPQDSYEEYFSNLENGEYDPVFIPVLEHRFQEHALQKIRSLISHGCLESQSGNVSAASQLEYGGIIFTSQRAVEAFSQAVVQIRDGAESGKSNVHKILSANMPLYVVGPATARGLRALNLQCPIVGEDSGNGENLAAVILEHYNQWVKERKRKLPLLFLVGEQRRDIIPKTLQSDSLGADRIQVDELTVYETTEMASFRNAFSTTFTSNIKTGISLQWVVVFSPTGCKAMLDSLGFLQSNGSKVVNRSEDPHKILIATIGPTTRDFLVREFGFHPDVCAPKPSPEGVGAAIEESMHKHADAE